MLAPLVVGEQTPTGIGPGRFKIKYSCAVPFTKGSLACPKLVTAYGYRGVHVLGLVPSLLLL